MPLDDLRFQFIDLGVQGLEVVHKALDQESKGARQFVAGVFQECGDSAGDVPYALGNDQAHFGQQASDLVGLGGSGFDEALAHRVQCQHALLLNVLDGHKAHVGAGYCLADGFCIGCVVFIGFDVGFDELGSYEFDGVAQALELASPVVGAAAGFHADQTRGQVHKERGHLVTLQLLLKNGLAVRVDAVELEDVLCQIDA